MSQGIRGGISFGGRSFRAQFRAANRSEAPYALVLGDDELATQEIVIQDMREGTKEKVPLSQVVDTICSKLGVVRNETSLPETIVDGWKSRSIAWKKNGSSWKRVCFRA